MKKRITFLFALVLALMLAVQSVSAINVIMNSSYLEFADQEPVVENGVTLVPIRSVAEALGLTVTWDDPSDTVVLKKDNFYIEMVIGKTTAKTSAGVKELPVAPKIINSRTMVPLRFITEELGLKVLWNEKYQRIVINGQVDTQSVPEMPTEFETDVYNTDDITQPAEGTAEDATEFVEEETEFEEEQNVVSISTPSSRIAITVPLTFVPEDTDDEQSFAYRSLDAFDAQHTYNWDAVTIYESYALEDASSGLLYIVQELEPYEGDEPDVSRAMDEYPEAPERVDLDFGYVMSEARRLLVVQICADREVEVPEGYEDMEDEELAVAIGFESADEMGAFMGEYDLNEMMEQIPEYVDYMLYREEYNLYREESAEISNAKNYAYRMFSEVQSTFSDEEWAEFFTSWLNSDVEVRYEGVEIIELKNKKIIHATIYAEDPDDEQGTYDYYLYPDGDFRVTIVGGSLFASEASPDVLEALSTMTME